MRNISLDVVKGRLTEQRMDALFNSSNTYMILGSGTAEDVRNAGGYLPAGDNGYWKLVEKSKKNSVLYDVLEYVHKMRPTPSKAQKARLEYLSENGFMELGLGDAVVLPSCDIGHGNGPKFVVDLAAMTYRWGQQPNPPIIRATLDTVRQSVLNGLRYADKIGCESVAIPVICTRKGGLTKKVSSEATSEALREFDKERESVKDVNIVLYSEELQKDEDWFRKFYRF